MELPSSFTWDPITTALIAVIAYFSRETLKAITTRLQKHEEILTKVVLEEYCEKMKASCSHGPDWAEFKSHYHTDVGPQSGVVSK
jgi:hypothetical protein